VSIILEENEYNEEEDDNEDEEEDGDSLQSENEEEDDQDGDDESPVKKKRRHSRKPTKLVTSDDEFDTDIEIEGFFFCLLFLLISARNIRYYKRSIINKTRKRKHKKNLKTFLPFAKHFFSQRHIYSPKFAPTVFIKHFALLLHLKACTFFIRRF